MTKDIDSVVDHRDADVVWIGLKVFVHEMGKYLAAVKAVGEIQQGIGKKILIENEYLVLAEEAIWRQLVLNITKFFDTEKTGKYYNCSLKMLKTLCLEEKNLNKFPKGQDDPLIRAIDTMYDKYNSTITLYVRNKKVAHHDLNDLFSPSIPYILFSDIEELVNESTDLVYKIGIKLWGIPLEYPSISAENYKEAILRLINDEVDTV
ncbi:MAG: hypothetical protein ABFC62_08400 [Clostridiaceae bacterium]